MKISDVYNGDSLMIQDTELNPGIVQALNRKEQAELCVFLADTRPQMILTAIAAAEAAMKKEMK